MMATTYLDIRTPGKDLIEAGELVQWWRKETDYWLTRYHQVEDTLENVNPFRDPVDAVELREELARLASNVAECSGELVGWLNEL